LKKTILEDLASLEDLARRAVSAEVVFSARAYERYHESSPGVWNTLRISIVWKAALHSGNRRHQRSAGTALPKACFIHFSPDFAAKLRAVRSGQSGRLLTAGKQFFGINEAVRGIAESCLQKRAKARPINEFGRERCAVNGHTVV
jgi:hypothetical protein